MKSPRRSSDEPQTNGVKLLPMSVDRPQRQSIDRSPRQGRRLVAQQGANSTVRTNMLYPSEGGARESDTLSVHSYLCPKMSDASTITDVFSSSMDDEMSVYRRDGSRRGAPGSLSVCRRSRACCVVLYIWIFLFMLSCVIAIVLVVTRIVLPYTRTVHFVDTLCFPIEGSKFVPDISCSCGRSCQTVYPCLTIMVEYNDADDITHQARIFDSEDRLSKQVGSNIILS